MNNNMLEAIQQMSGERYSKYLNMKFSRQLNFTILEGHRLQSARINFPIFFLIRVFVPKQKTRTMIASPPERYLLWINIIQMVLYELHASGKVSLIELVRDVPAQWAKLTPLL